MPHPLIDNPNGFPTITVPDPLDSGNAASVEGPFQGLTNRSANLAQRIGGTPASNGVARLQVVPDIPGLRSLTPHADGDVARVRGGALYEFRAEAGGVDDGKWVIRPNDILGGGPGKWLLFGAVPISPRVNAADLRNFAPHTDQDLARIRGVGIYEYRPEFSGDDDGLCTIRPSDVPSSNAGRWRIIDPYRTLSVDSYEIGGQSISNTGASSYVDSAAAVTISANLIRGDILNVHGRYVANVNTASSGGDWVVSVAEGATTIPTDIAASQCLLNSGPNGFATQIIPFSFRFVVQFGGTCIVRVRMRVQAGGSNPNVSVAGPAAIVVHAYRP
ncbi:hypothetical protein LZC95_50245 [Pendulispora brunnea]|uniref:Uncharacterized protein n=1 Tax=Pendulispora brunnea TaxID=2905690 RepID=A0ABZ2K7C6_9BACT